MEATPIKVLVVDDDADGATATSALLECYGFSVETALSGEEGIESAMSFCPDVVILDLAMPEIDGINVANILLQNDEAVHAKLIAYTGYSCGSAYQAALSAGFHKIVCKPAPVEILIGAILEVTRRKTTHNSSRY
jgi:two-component system CheB/CheR fusion protein